MSLIDNMDKELSARILCFQRFEAPTSPRQAWLDITVLEHPGGGFLIMQRSGPAGSINSTTTYFSWSLPDALTKYQTLVNKRLHKRSGRIYSTVPHQQSLQL